MNSDPPRTVLKDLALYGEVGGNSAIRDLCFAALAELTDARATIARLEGEQRQMGDDLMAIEKMHDEQKVVLYTKLAAKEAELQALKRQPGEAHPCCTEYATCLRACTPRGEWIAEQRLKG